ncbi:DUF3800 domain-containing protein [Aeoliella sp.]|uniref:DUF3800 domain-containing protein n=1 Tax=Aeoliella sp. TaxID=2795800 RepID=UPI003CCB97DB
MLEFDFNYFGISIDKAKIAGFNRPFLHNAEMTAFSLHASKVHDATIVIDKTGSSNFRKMMAKCLKEDLNRQYDDGMVKKVKSEESHKHNLLQLADMACGAISRSFHPEKKGEEYYRDLIRSREWTVSSFP